MVQESEVATFVGLSGLVGVQFTVATGKAGFGWLPFGFSFGEFTVADVEVDGAGFYIEFNKVISRTRANGPPARFGRTCTGA